MTFFMDRNRKLPAPATVFVDSARFDWPVHTEAPWLVEIWEPLRTKAPNPCLTLPFCCYRNTIIFYVRGYVSRPWSKAHFDESGRLRYIEKPHKVFEEWGRTETVITWNSALDLNGRRFEALGGRVCWKHKRWWMRRWARRIPNAA
jgi:hypothetical protein